MEDGTPLRVRVRLADRAGALAQVATVLGLHGGNILSVDVHRGDGLTAVDDLVVDFAGEPGWEDLEADLAAISGAELVSLRPAESDDPVAVAIDLTASLTAGSVSGLAEACARLCSADRVWVAPAGETAAADGRLLIPLGETDDVIGLERDGDPFTPTETARTEALVAAYLRL